MIWIIHSEKYSQIQGEKISWVKFLDKCFFFHYKQTLHAIAIYLNKRLQVQN